MNSSYILFTVVLMFYVCLSEGRLKWENRKFFISTGPCKYNGKSYKIGQVIPTPTEPCKKCECVEKGVECRKVLCVAPPCADPEYRDGGCCPICPNGRNCMLEDRKLPEGHHVILWRYEGCVRTCSCPHVYPRYTLRTAVCRTTCRGGK